MKGPSAHSRAAAFRSGNRGHTIDVVEVVINNSLYDGSNRGGPEKERAMPKIRTEAARHKAANAAGRRSDAIENLIRPSWVPRAVPPPHQTTRDERRSRTWKRDDLYDPMRDAGWTRRSLVYSFDEGFLAVLPWARQRIVDGIG